MIHVPGVEAGKGSYSVSTRRMPSTGKRCPEPNSCFLCGQPDRESIPSPINARSVRTTNRPRMGCCAASTQCQLLAVYSRLRKGGRNHTTARTRFLPGRDGDEIKGPVPATACCQEATPPLPEVPRRDLHRA